MSSLPFLRGFLRTLVGLPERTSPFWGIERVVASDIERARWKRAMRESGEHNAEFLGRYVRHLQAGGSALAFMQAEAPGMLAPPPVRPVAYPPHVYRMMLARSGASLRPPPRHRDDA